MSKGGSSEDPQGEAADSRQKGIGFDGTRQRHTSMDAEKRARRIHANVLVDTVRRHALLPSDLMEKIGRCLCNPLARHIRSAPQLCEEQAVWMESVALFFSSLVLHALVDSCAKNEMSQVITRHGSHDGFRDHTLSHDDAD